MIRKGIETVAILVFILAPYLPLQAEDITEMFAPLPEIAQSRENPVTPEKVELGKLLYFEPRLSKSALISCNSCHSLTTAGVDNLPTSVGHGWQIGGRNAPTVLNAAVLGSQFWDGRAKTVEEQAKGPITNPIEMAATEELVVKRLKSIPEYVALFKKVFPQEKDPITLDNMARAIAAFERTLMTPSPFDTYLKGDKEALTEDARKGLKLFVKKGCVFCHNGVGVGGDSFQKFDYGTDQGRYTVTKDEKDKKVFRVASLRNVAITYPYFHDGSVWSLEEAVKIMARKQLGVRLEDREVKYMVAFLESLTGKRPDIIVPVLPPSTAETPRPDVSTN